MRKLKLFLDVKAANTPPRGISKASRVIFSVLTLLFLSVGNVWATDPVDVLTASDLTATNTTYVDFSNVSKNSTAVYAGQSAKTSSGGIQLRSKNSNSGIVSTTSGGVVKSVKITVESGSNTIDIYGSNIAYTGATDLYDSNKQGTKVGSLSATETITFTDEYAYVGVRSNSGALYLSSVEITWTSPAPPTYTITAESNNTTYGTVSLIGSVITGSPKPGYRYADLAYSVSPANSATVSQVGDAFTVTPSANTTVTVNFEQIPSYTVTWNNNGDESVTTQVYEGEKPVFPEPPTSCDATSTTFIGWATDPWTGKIANLNEKTVYTSADAMPAVSGAVTYYAVFAKVAGESGWVETAIGNLSASDVFVFADANGYALTNNNGTSSAVGASALTISAGKITSTVTDILKWNISGNATDGYTFYPNGSTTTWLYCNTTESSSSNNNMRVGTGDRKLFEIDNAGYVVTKDTYTDRYLSRYDGNTSPDFRGYINTNTNPVAPKFYKYSAGTASDYMTTCCTKYNITIADGIEHGSIAADVASACEGTTVTITFSPAGGYHLDSWSVNGTAQDVAASTFSMPAAAVEVSATFAHDDCENLAAPTLDAVTKNYNSATIAWNEVTDAEEYAVSVVNHATSASVFAGNVDALSKALADLEPETQYDYTIMAIGDGTVKCTDGNGVLEGNFTTDALPTAVLTLMENGNEVAGGSHAITVPFALPTAVTHTCGKTFVGWTSKSNFVDGDEALPSYYEKGAEFTFENTTGVTLYAVYADEAPGAETPVTDNIDLTFTGVSGTSYVAWSESKTGTSGAVYTGVNAGGNSAIQFRSDVSDTKPASGIVSTTTGGKAKKVTITWNSNTADGRTLNVFGSNTAYTAVADLVDDNNKGTLLGTVVKGTSTVLNITGNYQYIGVRSNSGAMYIDNVAIEWAQAGASTFDNYSITCAAAPTAEPASASIAVAAAGGEGTLGVSYENVNLAGVEVALFNNEACTEAFDGGWLTASIAGDDKHIAYNAQANTSYNDARTAYIKLTAPETNGAANPAVVVIPVEQAKKSAVFASLEDLVAANLASGTEVTVSFSNILITEVYTTNAGYRYGLYLNVKDKDGEKDIELFYNKQGNSEQVPETWVKNGYVSATNLVGTWTLYNSQWELAMQGATWSWENGDITYGAPKAVSSVVVSGEPTKKAYVDGEKFNPAGLTVTVNYTVGDPEVIDAADADWVYETSDVMALNQTSINVKATYNTVTSENFYEVTDLTVNPISNKTIAQFIADEGGRCYLEGIVSGNINTTYGNFDLQDETGTIYVYGSDVFEDHGVALGDKVKVIAEEYLLYKKAGNPDKDEALNVVFVSKISPVAITIADKTLEVGDEWTIEATTDPAAAVENISYSIKAGSDECISLAGNVITATAEGEATIIASVEDGDGYLANSVEFTVTVYPAGSTKEVVILVQYDGKYLAMTHEMKALEVEYKYGKLYDVAAAKQAEIIWTRTIAAGTATFSYTESEKVYYLKGSSSTTMTVVEGATGAYQWTWNENEYYTTNTTGTIRTFLYQGNGQAFKNYAVSNAGESGYSSYAEFVEEPQFMTTYTRPEAVQGQLGTICVPNGGRMEGATPFEIAYMDYDANNNPYKIYLDEVEEMVAGRPYFFLAEEENPEVKVYYSDSEDAAAGNYRGLYGTYSQINQLEQGYYIVYNNMYYHVNTDNVKILANRAYIKLSEIPGNVPAKDPSQTKAPRRISMSAYGTNVATGVESIQPSEVSIQKVLINGELFILRGEKMYDAKGQLVK